METEILVPSVGLRKLVTCYLIIKNNKEIGGSYNFPLPKGLVGIVFNLGASGGVLKIDGNSCYSGYFILSSDLAQYKFEIGSPAELFVVCCREKVFFSIFDINPLTAFHKSINPTDLFEGYPMLKTLKEIRQPRERISFFENFILHNTSIRSFNNNLLVHDFSALT